MSALLDSIIGDPDTPAVQINYKVPEPLMKTMGAGAVVYFQLSSAQDVRS